MTLPLADDYTHIKARLTRAQIVEVSAKAAEKTNVSGFFSRLTPEQQKAALEYRGEDC